MTEPLDGIDHRPPAVFRKHLLTAELWKTLVGKCLGGGMSRKTYKCKLNKDIVIKVEDNGCHFQNVVEWEIWREVQFNDKQKIWFAPCVDISPCGTILIMKRTVPFDIKEAPKQMPRCLTDFKLSNYGTYKDHVVCHDYGTAMLLTHNPFQLRKVADWNDFKWTSFNSSNS